jgi:predicted lipid-binding transport protein (Tim44 family)
MPRLRVSLAAVLAIAIALAPGLALARVGGGSSMGSRGGFTYSAPPATSTAPYSAAPMQRSFTPQSQPSMGAPAPGYAPAFGGRGAFTSGLMGGLLGAGIGGMLFGHGMFGGIDGGGSLIGLLIQFALLFFIGRWLYRTFMARQTLFAGAGGGGVGGTGPRPAASMFGGGGRAAPPPIAIGPADYQAFEQLLKAMQAAWSAQDLNALRTLATPEMTSYFAEQLAELNSRGLHNVVSNVHLDSGDLSQAWSEGSREYATVAMRFSMIDVTQDPQGRVVDGSPTERQVVTEVWTFLRSPGGRWILSAIQQTR